MYIVYLSVFLETLSLSLLLSLSLFYGRVHDLVMSRNYFVNRNYISTNSSLIHPLPDLTVVQQSGDSQRFIRTKNKMQYGPENLCNLSTIYFLSYTSEIFIYFLRNYDICMYLLNTFLKHVRASYQTHFIILFTYR